jgi:hypothetical protein
MKIERGFIFNWIFIFLSITSCKQVTQDSCKHVTQDSCKQEMEEYNVGITCSQISNNFSIYEFDSIFYTLLYESKLKQLDYQINLNKENREHLIVEKKELDTFHQRHLKGYFSAYDYLCRKLGICDSFNVLSFIDKNRKVLFKDESSLYYFHLIELLGHETITNNFWLVDNGGVLIIYKQKDYSMTRKLIIGNQRNELLELCNKPILTDVTQRKRRGVFKYMTIKNDEICVFTNANENLNIDFFNWCHRICNLIEQ